MTDETALARVHAEMKAVAASMGSIRFLPQRQDEGIFWVRKEPTAENYRVAARAAMDLARMHGTPVFTQVKRRAYRNVVPLIGTIYDQPAASKHRSKRLWKKLRRKTARPLYGEPMVLSFNPERLKILMGH